ncbi:MAG: hypothetical protein ACP5XB_16775 [Isosphaeraceae bacterium]
MSRFRIMLAGVIASAFLMAVIGGCDSSSDQPAPTGPPEGVTKANQNMENFMKTQGKGAPSSAKKK